MTRLDRDMLTQLLLVFGFFALVLVAIFWVNRAVYLFGMLVGDGQSMRTFMEITALVLPDMIHIAVPVATLVATLYLVHRWVQESELIVLRAAGMSPLRMARPFLLFGLMGGAFMLVLMHFLIPQSREQLADRQASIAENLSARFVQDGSFQHPAEGITLFVRELTPEGRLNDIYLADARDISRRLEFTAASAFLVAGDGGQQLVMLAGQATLHDSASGRISITRFDSFTYDVGALIAQRQRGRDPTAMSTAELWRADAGLIAASSGSTAYFQHELVRRFSYPLMPLVAALLGFAALQNSGYSRLGSWGGITVAALLGISVEMGNNTVASIAQRSEGLAFINFIPAAIGLAIATALLALSLRERRGGSGLAAMVRR